MAKILIAHVDGKMMTCMGAFGDRLRYADYDVIEISIIPVPSDDWQAVEENNFKCLTDLLTGKPVFIEFDLVIIFDEFEHILKRIKNVVPTKVPVFYVDIFRETKPVEGFTWFSGVGVLPSTILEEADKLLKK